MIVFSVAAGVGSYLSFNRPAGSQVTSTRPLSSYKLSGNIFFDYNGNGKQEMNKPPMVNVAVALDNVNITMTNSTGSYLIERVAEGQHSLRIYAPSKYRYMCESNAEFRSAKEVYIVQVTNNTRKDLGLMEGFLTMPFAEGTSEWYKRLYVDIANKSLTSRGIDWRGGDQTYQRPEFKHEGIDYWITEGNTVVVAAPGVVSSISQTNFVAPCSNLLEWFTTSCAW